MIVQLAQPVEDVVHVSLATQRKTLAKDSNFVIGLRDDRNPELRARLDAMTTRRPRFKILSSWKKPAISEPI
ncbi:hypothetical protein [Gemmobacter serpentinus]|uniref:hypothetical protein n=1 Tax=Gemmobacter serpentinus TaxID=2652247 RepID=UPI00124DA178|nr:hypothetical protein [Gemmobacter serpentinus]